MKTDFKKRSDQIINYCWYVSKIQYLQSGVSFIIMWLCFGGAGKTNYVIKLFVFIQEPYNPPNCKESLLHLWALKSIYVEL